MKRTIILALAIILAAASGCTAGFFLVGAEMHQTGAPSNVAAAWTVPTCENLTDGSTTPGPAGGTYYLELEPPGPALYELDAAGTGARIVNHWEDAEGYHFFTYVKTSGAWHYVIPKDLSQPAMRYAYEAISDWNTETTGEVTKPTGTPSWKCPMVKK